MHTEVRFGIANKPKKIQQSLYIRIKHNNLDWNRSLKIKIDADDWNFKKQEIITSKPGNHPMHSKNLREVSQKVYEISRYLQYASESYYHTNHVQIKQWVKEKQRKLFIDLCDKWYSDYYNQNEVITQPYFIDAYQEAKENFEQTEHGNHTRTRWDNIQRNLQAYMDTYGNVRTDEFSSNVWKQMIKFLRDEYQHRDKTNNVGLSDHTILTILKKIRAVKNHLENKYIFHYDMDNLKFIAKKKSFDTLTDDELERFFNVPTDPRGSRGTCVRKQWFFKIQYYGCFRISEVYKNLRINPNDKKSPLKTPREIWKNEVYDSKDAKGNKIKVWKCYHAKDKYGNGTKNIPIHDKLAECLFGSLENAERDIFPDTLEANGIPVHDLFLENTQLRFMKSRLKELGIKKEIASHEIRKSFITNQLKKGKQTRDLMQYSGHDSEATFNLYINQKDNYIPTEVDLKE